MIDLERDLRDLGEHLDHPTGDQIVPQLRVHLSMPTGPVNRPQRRRRRAFVTAVASVAAVLLVVVALFLALDSGGTASKDRSAVSPSRGTERTATTTTTAPLPAVLSLDLTAARAAVEFPIGVPGPAGTIPTTVTVDRRVPGGMVVLDYPAFTVVEVASPPNAATNLAPTIAAEGSVQMMSVRGRPALWITGTHPDVPYLDREGTIRRAPTRPTGHVLLWEENGVTYRVEGFEHEWSAREMASSIS